MDILKLVQKANAFRAGGELFEHGKVLDEIWQQLELIRTPNEYLALHEYVLTECPQILERINYNHHGKLLEFICRQNEQLLHGKN